MAQTAKKLSRRKKILIGVLIFLGLCAVTFQIFITYYLPPLVKNRLSDIVVKGSDSLYRLEVGKFVVGFWGGTVKFTHLRITADSARYKELETEKKLPPLTFDLDLPGASITGIRLWKLFFSQKIDIDNIHFTSASIKLARHFKTTDTINTESQPLWKLIQPGIRSIKIKNALCSNLKLRYQNVDYEKAYIWQFDKCNIQFADLMVDSLSALDTNRLLFAKNVAMTVRDVSMKTPDNLYNLMAKDIFYTSAGRLLEINQFNFLPAMSKQQFSRYYGYQHEIYELKIPAIHLKNFALPQWINYNRLQTDTIELASPSVAIHIDRNAKPNPHSRKGKYPNQLLQKAPFIIHVKRLKATDASVTYTETSNVTQMTGRLVFPSLQGVIDNITNDPDVIDTAGICIADIRGTAMKTGSIHTVFRFSLSDRNGAFGVKATITNLNAAQLHPLFKAMTSTDIQSLNMKRLDYSIHGDEDMGKGTLQMRYDDMDILLNRIKDDKTFDKKGLLSFLANRLAIYKENPMNDESERKATGIVVHRDVNRSFFYLIWKTLFASAGEIVLRPMGHRRAEKIKERQQQKVAKQSPSRKK